MSRDGTEIRTGTGPSLWSLLSILFIALNLLRLSIDLLPKS